MPSGIYKHKPNQGFQKGSKCSEETKRKIINTLKKYYKTELSNKQRNSVSKVLKGKYNEKNNSWKGNSAGKVAMHMWIKRNFGKASKCENPNCVYPRTVSRKKIMLKPKRFDWANIGHTYRRKKEDWIMLCPSCHKLFDLKQWK